jgi:hypothetical protein
MHGRIEDRVATTALGLGTVERHVGVAQQVLGRVRRRAGDHADAGRRDDRVLTQAQGAVQRLKDPLRHAYRLARLGQVAQQDGELAAAQAATVSSCRTP